MLFILAVAIIVTGILMQTFASLPNGLVPWAIVFVVAVLYPLSLSHVFRRNRADYEFRLLHWLPAFMLLLWLFLQGILLLWPQVVNLLDWYTWGWSLPAVATGFLLMIIFIFKVIRRWTVRLALLALAFVPFMAGGIANEYYNWNPQIAASLWQGDWWQIDTSTGTQIAQKNEQNSSEDSKNLSASLDPTEEQYRERLRAIERRRERIANRIEQRGETGESTSSATAIASADTEAEVSSASSASTPMLSSSSSLPTALPSSGFGWAAILVLLAAGYCAAVQRKTALRIRD